MGKPITVEKLLGKIDSILNQGIIPLLGMVQKKKRCLSNQKRCLENHLSKHKKVKEDCRILTDFLESRSITGIVCFTPNTSCEEHPPLLEQECQQILLKAKAYAYLLYI